MLITLVSDQTSNASDFTNYFKQTVQIEPNSEIAFVSIGYTIKNVAGDRETQVMLVNLDDFEIDSMCKEGGIQKSIASVCYGASYQDTTKFEGEFFYEAYNLIYQKLGNKEILNNNQLRVRLTDNVGNPLTKLIHPTTITIDIRPKMN
jgi:hypothetical protein